MATVNVTEVSFGDLCRLCGTKTNVLLGLHIFEREGDIRGIYRKIKECLPIQVDRGDKLPKFVCEECAYKLDALSEFRELSLKTEYALHNILKTTFATVCNETLNLIPIESFCTAGGSDGTIHIENQTVEIISEHHLDDSNRDPLISLPFKGRSDEEIKCEPGLVVFHEAPKGSGSIAGAGGEGIGGKGSGQQTPSITSQEILVADVWSLKKVPSTAVSKSNEIVHSESYILDGVVSETGEGPNVTEAWYFCNVCGKSFPTNGELDAHCESHWLKCPDCGIPCNNEQVLAQHMQATHQAPQKEKEHMGVFEVDLQHLDMAKKNESAPKPEVSNGKKCAECGKVYKTKYKLAEHMRRHTGEKPFKCSMCDKSFRSRIGLAQHEAKHTGRYDFYCDTCGKGFQCKSYLAVHQRVHSEVKPFPCETCGRNFKTKQSLIDHQNRHLGVKPYTCDICGRGFITKGLCRSHEKIHTGQDNRQYPCNVCNKLFVSKSYLTTHYKIHTGEKPFMCEVCGKGFLTRVDLRIHSTMHTGEKSFVCEVCGKAFARRDALRCHKRSHTGERPYKCDICGQGFTQFSPMAIHRRLHTGERPYSCDICLKGFVSRSTMMSHRKKHTNGTS